MINRCILIFPVLKNIEVINNIRKKYDPLAEHVKPHVTLVFPFKSDISGSELKVHMENALSGINRFNVKLNGIKADESGIGYMFLLVSQGNKELTKMHKRLYSGVLKEFFPEFLRTVDYMPHMTIGHIEDALEFEKAKQELRDFSEEFSFEVSEITVENINENEDSIIEFSITLS